MKRLFFLVALSACTSAKVEGYATPPADGAELVDPVTKDRCTKTPLTAAAVYESKTYYFCNAESPAKFRADPARFAGAS